MAEENENVNQEGLFNKDNIKTATEIVDSIKEVRDATRETNKELKSFELAQQNISKEFGVIQSGANKVASIQAEAAKSSKATSKAIQEQTKQQNAVKTLNERINKLYEQAEGLQGDIKDAVLDQARNLTAARDKAQALADTFEGIADDAAALDKRTSFFDAFGDLAENSKVFKQFASPFRDAAKAARETVISNQKNGKSVSVLGAGMKGFAASAAKSAMNFMKSGGFIGLIATGIGKLVKLMLNVDARSAKTAKAFNETKLEAAETAMEFQKAEKNVNFLTDRLGKGLELARGFADATGIISKNTEVFNSSLDTLNAKFGLSTEQTQELANNLLASGQSTKDFATEALGAAEAFEMQNGFNVQSQAIMKDVADASAAFKVNSGFSAKNLGNAAAQARKVGLSLSQVEKISESLLDFDQSIEKEMTAQLMTGKAINLDKARQFALQGDLAGVASEISKQEAVREAFATNNVLAQNAVAEALGMSREELAKMYTDQKALEESGFKSAKDREDKFNTLVREVGMAEALKQFGDQEFAQMKQRSSIQEKINNLIANMKDMFMTAVEGPVAKLTSYLESNPQFINDIMTKVKEFAESLGGPNGKIVSMLSTFTSIKNVIKGLGQIINAAVVQPLKVAYHGAMATYKVLEAAFYAGTARFGKARKSAAEAADHTALALTSALDIGTGIIAGVGTMAGEENLNATGISDAYKKTGGVSGEANVKDFILKPLDEDTITMAGGTKLGGNVEALLHELIAVVRGGGDVYLDGSKVGQTLVMNAKLSN